MMHRMLLVGLLVASVSGVFFFYGKLQYQKGLHSCEMDIAKQKDEYADFLVRSYEQAFEHNSQNFQRAEQVYKQIRNLPKAPHQKILRESELSTCKHLGSNIVQLFNDFTQTGSSNPNELRHVGSNESSAKKQDS